MAYYMAGLGQKHQRNMPEGLCQDHNDHKIEVCWGPNRGPSKYIHAVYKEPPGVLLSGVA